MKNISKKHIDAFDKFNYVVNLKSTKDRVKYIKTIERICRSSLEYKNYIAFLRENINMTKCSFFNGVENGDAGSKHIRIEIHHDPLTLFDITDTIITKFQENGTPLDSFMIADEVMANHYSNRVGLIPLSKTIHEMVHNSDKIFIPLHLVYGRYKEFFNEYGDYMSDELYKKLESKITQTKSINTNTFDSLKVEYVYLDVEGFTLPHRIEKYEDEVG